MIGLLLLFPLAFWLLSNYSFPHRYILLLLCVIVLLLEEFWEHKTNL
jgi:hypothetical protein